jgi:hypothetical protein
VNSATFNPSDGFIYFGMSERDYDYSAEYISLHKVSFYDFTTVSDFCTVGNPFYVNINPGIAYNLHDGLFYISCNTDTSGGLTYAIKTVAADNTVADTPPPIDTTQLAGHCNGFAFFNNYLYGTESDGNNYKMYYADISTAGNVSAVVGSQTNALWSVNFDVSGDFYGCTQITGDNRNFSIFKINPVNPSSNEPITTSPINVSHVGDLPLMFNGNIILNTTIFSISACIHGSSVVQLFSNDQKPICEILASDVLMGPDGKQVNISQVVKCWNNEPNMKSQQMIIFNKNSIARGIPSDVFGIDPNHPMCTVASYLKRGDQALRRASTFVNNRTIRCSTIDRIHAKNMLPPSVRYDLILENSDVYIANNLVIKGRRSFKESGY